MWHSEAKKYWKVWCRKFERIRKDKLSSFRWFSTLEVYYAYLNHHSEPVPHHISIAVQSLKKGKSAGVDNIPAGLVQAGGEDVITALTTICNKIWTKGEWPTPWTQSLTEPELSNNKPHQSPKHSHAEDHTEQTEATSGEDHPWRTGRLQSRKEYHRADFQPAHSMWEISPAPARPLPCLHRLQEGLWQGFACSFVGNHEEVQHQHKPYPSHQKPL